MRRAKYLFRRMNRVPRDEDDIVTAFRDGQVTLRSNRREDGFTIAAKEIGYQGVRRGDLVIHAMDAFAGAVGVSDSDGKSSPVYAVCQPEGGVDPRYYAYMLRHMAGSGFIVSLARGIRERSTSFGFSEFAGLALLHPPAAVQHAIADFLDRKTAAIDALIERKERLLALLAEKRAALIHHAVTKGLDPDVPMKDSGVPWIGEVPAHWDVKLLRYLGVLQRGFDLPSGTRRDGTVPVYAGGGVSGYHDRACVRPPGVVTGRYGTVGVVHLVHEPFWPLNTALYIKEFWGNSPAFVRHVLQTLPLESLASKAAVPGLDRNDVHRFPVVVPPRQEQDAIVEFLANHGCAHARMDETTRSQIDRLREYRQALITAAVTGQIDVTKEHAA